MMLERAQENGIPELYKEASRYVLDAYNSIGEDLAILSPTTLLRLERRRSNFLERLLKLGQVSILRDYSCHSHCDEPARCAWLVDEKWRSAFSAAFRFGTPQPCVPPSLTPSRDEAMSACRCAVAAGGPDGLTRTPRAGRSSTAACARSSPRCPRPPSTFLSRPARTMRASGSPSASLLLCLPCARTPSPSSRSLTRPSPALLPSHSLFDRMFGLGITPARNWTSLTLNHLPNAGSAALSPSASGGGGGWMRAVGEGTSSQRNAAKYFLFVEMRDEAPGAGAGAAGGRRERVGSV